MIKRNVLPCGRIGLLFLCISPGAFLKITASLFAGPKMTFPSLQKKQKLNFS